MIRTLQGLGIEKWVWDAWHWGANGVGLELSVPLQGSTVPPSRPAGCWWAPPGVSCAQFYNATHVQASEAGNSTAAREAESAQRRALRQTADAASSNSSEAGAGLGASAALQPSNEAESQFVAVPMEQSQVKSSPVKRVQKKLDSHDTGSKKLWRSMYTENDPEIAETVYRLYQADFESFGYEKESFDNE